MEHFPHKIAAAVFVTAFMPLSGTTLTESLNEDLLLFDSLEKKFPIWQEPLLYTAKNYGSVKRIYVVAKEDKLIVEVLQRKIIADNPPQMVYEVEGADHTVFFSKPLQLAEMHLKIANS